MQQCAHLVASSKEEHGRFFAFIDKMINAYQNGSRLAHGLDLSTESLEKENAFSCEAGVKGKLKLLSSYKEQFGDPATNGLGHTVTRTRWKDGTEQDVVMVPNSVNAID